MRRSLILFFFMVVAHLKDKPIIARLTYITVKLVRKSVPDHTELVRKNVVQAIQGELKYTDHINLRRLTRKRVYLSYGAFKGTEHTLLVGYL